MTLRIIGAFCLLTLDVTPKIASPFWGLYTFCGMTDIVDGCVARKLKAETKTGALLDSYADIAFVVCSAIKLHPFLIVPSWLWMWAGIIVVVKIMNQISAWVIHRKFIFLHTFANKLTGFCLFICIPAFVCFGQLLPLLITSFLAMFAAVQEGYYVKTKE